VLLSPLLLLLALAVRFTSRGPVLHRQERIGLDGRVFTMLKFRTMREDAERIAGPSWTADNDPRITRVGAFLRRTKIDELPQLWNVLNGQMSLVGPRPETPHFVEQLTDQLPVYRERVSGVKPGITGMAQIHCEDDGSFFGSLREKIYYDMLYGANLIRMRHWYEPVLLDLGIILKTLRRLVDVRKSIENDVIRIELPRHFELLDFDPQVLANNTPHGVRLEVLDNNPDKITVWWYLPRTRPEAPPSCDYMGVQVMRRLTDDIGYERNKDGKGVNELRLVKHLMNDSCEESTDVIAGRHAPAPDEPEVEITFAVPVERCDVIKLEAPSKVQYIPKVEEFLAPIWERLSGHSADPNFSFNMSLLVLEGLTNVIKHAHRAHPEKRIPLEVNLNRERVQVSVLDYGEGFELEQVPEQEVAEDGAPPVHPLYRQKTEQSSPAAPSA
jgi:lipopolysaccharide/colanic/teichoic acid biosynthesis glycosyltransferase/anti-sigma regulatory factor (Ser/Thr protein kinase)